MTISLEFWWEQNENSSMMEKLQVKWSFELGHVIYHNSTQDLFSSDMS